MPDIVIESLSKRFGATTALADISLDFPAGSFTALLGPSGCGKTTLMRLLAGFEVPDAGRILFDGKPVADRMQQVPPEERGVAVVFQSYALWPHMSVAGNVAYPLATRKLGKAEIARRVDAALAMVDLAGFGGRRPDDLSGGQRQRVALARCLVAEAGIILFDEPLANLDAHLRAAMVEEFRALHRQTGATIIYITHDQSEALALADRIALMSAGRCLQFGAPQDIYHRPASIEAAGFVGRGRLVSATLQSASDGEARLVVAGAPLVARLGHPATAGPVQALLRPEALILGPAGLPGTVRRQTYRGRAHEIEVELAESAGRVILDVVLPPPEGSAVHVAVADAWVVPPE